MGLGSTWRFRLTQITLRKSSRGRAAGFRAQRDWRLRHFGQYSHNLSLKFTNNIFFNN